MAKKEKEKVNFHRPWSQNRGYCGHDDITYHCSLCHATLRNMKLDQPGCISDEKFIDGF